MKIANKKSFRISLYSTCPIYGKLVFDKHLDGSLKYFDKFGEIKKDNCSRLIIESIISQAELICILRCGKLIKY